MYCQKLTAVKERQTERLAGGVDIILYVHYCTKHLSVFFLPLATPYPCLGVLPLPGILHLFYFLVHLE
jgi:hypothetical protein